MFFIYYQFPEQEVIPSEGLGAFRASEEVILSEGTNTQTLILENYTISVSYLSSDPQTLKFKVNDMEEIRTIAEKNETCTISGIECVEDVTNCWNETIWSCHMQCPQNQTEIDGTSIIQPQPKQNCTQDCGFKEITKCKKVCSQGTQLTTCRYGGICLKDYVIFGIEPFPQRTDWNTTQLKIYIAITASPCKTKERIA